MIKAIIFDMDGVLIDSEPYWRQAEKEVFKNVGIDLTDDMCESTMGYRLDEVVMHWYTKYPWDGPSVKEIEEQVIERLIELVKSEAQPMEGVYEALELFRSMGFPIALASSSARRIIDTVTKKLEIKDYFKVIRSAEHEEYGKPHPAIFLHTAEDLKVEPTECLVIEDSFNGLLVAMAARMKTIVIPEDIHRHKPKFEIADVKLDSLNDVDSQLLKDAFQIEG